MVKSSKSTDTSRWSLQKHSMHAQHRSKKLLEGVSGKHSVHTWTKLPSNGEPKKLVVQDSLRGVIKQSIVHILPICATALVLFFNLRGIYIGVDLPGAIKSDTINILLLQLAAKAHEILIVTSFGVIILHKIRHELLFGEGIPLGLIGSGFAFSNIQFLIQKEFYGAMRYLSVQRNRWDRINLIALIVICGLTAAVSGPASAVLLVPKSQDYPAGGTDVYLSGAPSVFWPEDLSGDVSELRQRCDQENSAHTGICPAGGFMSLQERWSRVDYNNFATQPQPPYSKLLSGSHFFWPSHSPRSELPSLYAIGGHRVPGSQPMSWVVQAHAASAAVLQQLATDWWNVIVPHVGVESTRIDDRKIQASSMSALANVGCARAQNLSRTDRVVEFPVIGRQGEYSSDTRGFKTPVLSNQSVNHGHFSWVHLPDEYGSASIGAVFETPWSEDDESRTVVGCTAQLGWVPSTLRTDAYSFFAGWYPWGVTFTDRIPALTPVPPGQTLSANNGRIALGKDWLDLLTPPAPEISLSCNTTASPLSTIEVILAAAGLAILKTSENARSITEEWQDSDLDLGKGKTQLLEVVIASILADGLSRSGSHQIFNAVDLPLSTQIPLSYRLKADFNSSILSGKQALEVPQISTSDITTLRATMSLTGYAIRATLGSYIAMCALLVHALIASGHTIHLFIHRRTFRSWANISELIALAHNSQPTKQVLVNTGGGIHQLKTFAQNGRIRVRNFRGSAEDDYKIELVFDEPEKTGINDEEPGNQGKYRDQNMRSRSSAFTIAEELPGSELSTKGKPAHAPVVQQRTSPKFGAYIVKPIQDQPSNLLLSPRNESPEPLTTAAQSGKDVRSQQSTQQGESTEPFGIRANTKYG